MLLVFRPAAKPIIKGSSLIKPGFEFLPMKDYAFIFDMDGVIVDSNPYHKIALQQFCIKHGHPLTEEQLRTKIYGRTNKEWIAQLFGQLTPEQVARYADEKEALFRDLYTNDIRHV